MQQLPRDVYLEAAAVLEIIGAKWHTGRKRHLFTQTWDPDMFADVLETGEAPPANPLAYFATPPTVADDILARWEITQALHRLGRCVALEPSAGTGALAVAAAKSWAAWASGIRPEYVQSLNEHEHGGHDYTPSLHLVLVELDPHRARILEARVKPQIEALAPGSITVEIIVGDFLELTREQLRGPRLVLMNPPFSVPGDKRAWWTHLQHALAVVHERGGVGCIMPPVFRYSMTSDMPAALALVSRGTAWPIPSGAFKSAGTDIATWALTITAEEAGEPGIEVAAMVIESTCELMQKLEKACRATKPWGAPKYEDPKSTWMRAVLELSRVVALGETEGRKAHDQQSGGDPVSFSPEWQEKLARALWGNMAGNEVDP